MAVQIGKVGGYQPLLKAVEPVEGREDHNERRDPGQHAADGDVAHHPAVPDSVREPVSDGRWPQRADGPHRADQQHRADRNDRQHWTYADLEDVTERAVWMHEELECAATRPGS